MNTTSQPTTADQIAAAAFDSHLGTLAAELHDTYRNDHNMDDVLDVLTEAWGYDFQLFESGGSAGMRLYDTDGGHEYISFSLTPGRDREDAAKATIVASGHLRVLAQKMTAAGRTPAPARR